MLSRCLVLCLLVLASGCTPITHIHDPGNTYTAETTYLREVERYPYISIASHEVPEGILAFRDLTYVNYGRRALQLDMYAPEPTMTEARPAIVLVHGGGWRAGHREGLAPLAIALALRGYVVATISYRLSPEAPYPAAIHDTKAAIRWLRSQADTYGIDPEKIAVGGASAGGQIAALTGVTNGMPAFDPQAAHSHISSDAQVIVNLDGLSDFTSPEALKHEDDPRKNPSAAGQWFGGRYAEKTELWHEASPINYVRRGMPPIIFINSAQPRFSVGRDEMVAKLRANVVPHHVETLPDSPHSFWFFDPWLQPTAKIMADFLDVQFRYQMTCH